jgi:hypothetical protein
MTGMLLVAYAKRCAPIIETFFEDRRMTQVVFQVSD